MSSATVCCHGAEEAMGGDGRGWEGMGGLIHKELHLFETHSKKN